MKLLLDTQLLIWGVSEPERISPTAVNLIGDPENWLYFSVVSVWEIAIKTALGRGGFNIDARMFRNNLRKNDYAELLINSDHAFSAAALPPIHKDPFDRMLVAQATVEGLVLLTADATIARYPGPIQKV